MTRAHLFVPNFTKIGNIERHVHISYRISQKSEISNDTCTSLRTEFHKNRKYRTTRTHLFVPNFTKIGNIERQVHISSYRISQKSEISKDTCTSLRAEFHKNRKYRTTRAHFVSNFTKIGNIEWHVNISYRISQKSEISNDTCTSLRTEFHTNRKTRLNSKATNSFQLLSKIRL